MHEPWSNNRNNLCNLRGSIGFYRVVCHLSDCFFLVLQLLWHNSPIIWKSCCISCCTVKLIYPVEVLLKASRHWGSIAETICCLSVYSTIWDSRKTRRHSLCCSLNIFAICCVVHAGMISIPGCLGVIYAASLCRESFGARLILVSHEHLLQDLSAHMIYCLRALIASKVGSPWIFVRFAISKAVFR